jgi:hypothetical protein
MAVRFFVQACARWIDRAVGFQSFVLKPWQYSLEKNFLSWRQPPFDNNNGHHEGRQAKKKGTRHSIQIFYCL